MKKTLFLISILLFTSCQTFFKLMSKGELVSESNTTSIHYTEDFGLMIIPVSIKGKQYNFLIDTGAPNVLSLELAKELGLKKISKITVDDSQNNKDVHYLYNVDEIKINDFSFQNTTCIAIDINHPGRKIGCLDIDGIIGSNLMKEAIWYFNFENKEVTIAKSIDNLNTERFDSLNFVYNNQYLPKLPIKINGIESYISVDTGSNGRFRLNKKYLNDIQEIDSLSYITSNYGSFSSGIYGKGKNLTREFYIADSVLLDDHLIKGSNLGFQEQSSQLLGMQFFTQNKMIIDWMHKKIYLKRNSDANFTEEKGFMVNIDRKEDQSTFYIRNLYENYNEYDIAVGDTIISINGKSTELLKDNYCQFLHSLEEQEKLHFEVLKNNDTLKIDIVKKEIFN